MKTVKNIVLVAGLLLSVNYAVAQNNDPISQQAINETEMLTQKLNLTPEQNERVSAVVYGILNKNEGIKGSDYAQDVKNQIYSENAHAKDQMLKEILTEAQFEEYLKIK